MNLFKYFTSSKTRATLQRLSQRVYFTRRNTYALSYAWDHQSHILLEDSRICNIIQLSKIFHMESSLSTCDQGLNIGCQACLQL